MGLFCPCVLFGRNVEQVREDTPWTGPCICHAIFVEGGLAFAAATAALHGFIDPRTTFLIGEGLFFSWWMCGIYTGLMRQSLQKKYHLKVILILFSWNSVHKKQLCCQFLICTISQLIYKNNDLGDSFISLIIATPRCKFVSVILKYFGKCQRIGVLSTMFFEIYNKSHDWEQMVCLPVNVRFCTSKIWKTRITISKIKSTF